MAAEKAETTEQLLAKPPSFSVRIDKRRTLTDLKDELERRLDCEAKGFKVGRTDEGTGTEWWVGCLLKPLFLPLSFALFSSMCANLLSLPHVISLSLA